jgi:hypothetical protein
MKAKVSRDLRQILADPEARSKLIVSVLDSGSIKDEVTISTGHNAARRSYKVRILGLRPSGKVAA